MVSKILNGMNQLDRMVYAFANKHQIILDDIVIDDGVIDLKRNPHTVELRCSDQKRIVHVSTAEIIDLSVGVQHRFIIALMQLMPISKSEINQQNLIY